MLAIYWRLFQRSQGSALSFGVNHVRACPSICMPFQRARLECGVLRRPVESAAKSRHSALRQTLALFDHLVGGGEQRLRECQAQRLSRLEV